LILLARHGESVDNAPPARIQGRRDPPLSELGREQARALADSIAGEGLAALWCSHKRRALETAEAVAARTGLEPRVDERLAEVDMGDWTGRLRADVERTPEWAAWLGGELDLRFPGGESVAELAERVLAALRDVASAPLPALVVCHGGPIRVALGAAGGEGSGHVRNAEVFRLDPRRLPAAGSWNQPSR
jgi:broad specificity phosphatase PhoE